MTKTAKAPAAVPVEHPPEVLVPIEGDSFVRVNALAARFFAVRPTPALVNRKILLGSVINGKRIRLPAKRFGSYWYGTERGFRWFLDACTQANATPVEDLPTPRTPVARRKASDKAGAELVARGA